MRSISNEKFDELLSFMQEKEIDVLLIQDSETSRDVNLQYFSGHPTDGSYVLTSSGENCLIPWDLLLAKEHAQVDEIIDVSKYKNSSFLAFKDFVSNKISKSSPVVGVLPNIPYGNIKMLQQYMPEVKFYNELIHIAQKIYDLRATKTSFELDRLVEVTKLSNEVLKDIIKFAHNATDETENDLSFLVMKRMRELGAEDNSFPSLVANTDRGYQLHCHPYASNAKFAKQGLSIIDYGAKMNGYCSDVTQPFAFGELSKKQLNMIEISEKAYETAIEMIDIGVPLHKIGETARDILKDGGYSMNYALGHGIGLSEHDAPVLRVKPTDPIRLKYWREIKVKEGMIFTIEPGAYVKGEGGYRIENDVMIRNGKVEILTKAKFEHIH
jgi:Xaa-Pro aminopeptidase